MFLFCSMFSVDDPTYLVLIGLLSKKSYIYQYPRSALDEYAIKYNVTNPKQFKTKKALVVFLLRLWKEEFEQNPELYKAYQLKYGEFSLERISNEEEKDEDTQIADFQEMCRRIEKESKTAIE